MSVFDYTGDLVLFSPYEINVIEMMIEELNLKSMKQFQFLNEISLNEVELFWYKDSAPDNLGGFYYFSKNSIYINYEGMKDFYIDDCSYSEDMNAIIYSFSTIIHELCHYWQCKKHPILYFFLQIPFIRDYTIEKQAYSISDYLEQNNVFFNLSFKDLVEMKQKYNFSKNYYDSFEMNFLK